MTYLQHSEVYRATPASSDESQKYPPQKRRETRGGGGGGGDGRTKRRSAACWQLVETIARPHAKKRAIGDHSEGEGERRIPRRAVEVHGECSKARAVRQAAMGDGRPGRCYDFVARDVAKAGSRCGQSTSCWARSTAATSPCGAAHGARGGGVRWVGVMHACMHTRPGVTQAAAHSG